MYKIKEGFVVREIAGSYCVVAVGKRSREFKGVISLNETGAFLFNLLIKGATKEELEQALLSEYNVDAELAKKDVDNFIDNLQKGDFLE